MNAPNEKQLRLEEGVGTWIGEEQMLPSEYMPVGRTAQARTEARMCADGRIRVSDYTQSVDGNVTMQGHAVTVWNPSENCYVMYWFDAGGSPPTEFKGDYEGEIFVLKGSVPGGSLVRHRTDQPDADTMHTVSEVSSDGETWTRIFEGTYSRSGS